MIDCGETVPSLHRCGECGDDSYGILDLERLAEEFDGADWPNGNASSFVEWLKVRPALSYAASAIIEEEDDGPLAS